MGRWFPSTPLEALEALITRSWLIPKSPTPGAVVADAMRGPLAELIRALRPEHMLGLRDDYVWPKLEVLQEWVNPWRVGRATPKDTSELKTEFDAVLTQARRRP